MDSTIDISHEKEMTESEDIIIEESKIIKI